MILKWTLKIGWEAVECIHLAQDSYNWRTIVITAMKLHAS